MVSQPKISAIMASTELPSSSSNLPLRMQSSLVTPETKITNGAEDLSAWSAVHQPEASTQLERHSDLWFDDGSVICQAENTLFKVHMSQLARHSVCFRDMFSLPQPVSRRCSSTDLASTCITGNSQQSYRIPVIQLHDSAEDVGNLLTALYDGPAQSNFGDNGYEDFRSVSGILRLSTKYIIDSLRSKAIAHLSIAWPSDLKTWDTREDLSRAYENDPTSHGGHLYPHPIAIINLAREVNAPSLLPAAFYDLSRYSYTQIFEPTEEDPSYRPFRSASTLSAMDLQRLCLGKEAAQQTITSLITAMGSSQHVRPQQICTHAHIRRTSFGGVCISAAACRKDFSELVDLATQHYLFDRERGCCDPLYVAEELGQLKSAEFSECKACAKSLEAWAGREREKIWKSIPMWFRLDSSPISSPIGFD